MTKFLEEMRTDTAIVSIVYKTTDTIVHLMEPKFQVWKREREREGEKVKND